MLYQNWIELVGAIYLIFIGSIMDTPNFRSAFLFKFFPIGVGMFLALFVLKEFGIL